MEFQVEGHAGGQGRIAFCSAGILPAVPRASRPHDSGGDGGSTVEIQEDARNT